MKTETPEHQLKARQDAARFLRLLIEGCEVRTATDHAWRKCPHCLAAHAAQIGDPFAVRLLRIALANLETHGEPPE